MKLAYVVVASGAVLDTVSLVDGALRYETGAASSFFEGKRATFPGAGDKKLFRAFSDWSNGYIQLRPVAQVEAAAGAAGEARPLTPEEQAAGLDPEAIRAELEAAQAEVTSQWEDLAAPLTAAVVAAVAAALAGGALASLADLAVRYDVVEPIADALSASMLTMASTAARRASRELRGQGANVGPGEPDRVVLADRAALTAKLIAQGYTSAASREALRLAGSDPSVAEQAVRVRLDGLTESATGRGFVAEQIETAMFAAEGEGRHATFQQAEGLSGIRWMASEVADRNTCTRCADIDQKKWTSYAEARQQYPGVGNKDCLGGARCRGRLLALNDTDRNRLQDQADGLR